MTQDCVACGEPVEKELQLSKKELKSGKNIPLCFNCLKQAFFDAPGVSLRPNGPLQLRR